MNKKKFLIFPFILCLLTMVAKGQEIPQVKEYKLSNGMSVWLSEEHSQPIVSGAVVVKAGAKDSPGTGIAHYFEHIMFKGTEKIGTKDYEAEKVYMDSIVVMYDKLGLATDNAEIDSIQKEINRLSIEQAKYVIPNEFDHLISRFGGSGLNAYTTYDATVYFNNFIPDYIEQWAELNSERLLTPVFRLFQSELETVYEEKNMYSDNMYAQVVDKLLERFYKGSPYEYNVLGNTESLKKPSLTEMSKFFQKYYVGNNMGLMICGDFNSEEILPILEKTFGRIPAGEAKPKSEMQIAGFNGRESMKVKIPVPVVKAAGRFWRGPAAYTQDIITLEVLCSLLNNSNNTGYLDKLVQDNKLLMAEALCINDVYESGMIGFVAIPKLIFQSKSSAEKLAMQQIEKIKKGDFSEDELNAIKLQLRRGMLSQLENTDTRMENMISDFSKGLTWEEGIEMIANIDKLTKEDIIECANKYFTDNYLSVSKKYGSYPKDRLVKPDIQSIPFDEKSASERSAYYDSLNVYDKTDVNLKYVNFEEDCSTIDLGNNCKLYLKSINTNGLFEFNIKYEIGTREIPKLSVADDYLAVIGTDSLSYEQFRNSLQKIGSVIKFDSNDDFFTVTLNGFDDKFEETLKIVNHFFSSAKGNKKMLGQIKDALKIEEKSFTKTNSDVAKAISTRIREGETSSYLNRVTSGEVKKIKENELVDLFNDVQKYQFNVHYSGSLPEETVTALTKELVKPENVSKKSETFKNKKYLTYEKPVIYFYDSPKSRQTVIEANTFLNEPVDGDDRAKMRLLNFYWGGDMTSVMFQQIREFRSLAYGARSGLKMNAPKHGAQTAVVESKISTQADKTVEAFNLLDSLINDMPINESGLISAKRSMNNFANNLYPNQRDLTISIAEDQLSGYDKSYLYEVCGASDISLEDFEKFYHRMFDNSRTVYTIVGNKKNIDLEELKKYGEVIFVKDNFFYKK